MDLEVLDRPAQPVWGDFMIRGIENKSGESVADKPDLSFRAFVRGAMDGEFQIHDNLHEPFTYESWVRYQTIIEPLSLEYLKAGEMQWGEKGAGNFYDWMAEFKGIELTEEEQSLRIHK